MKVAIIGNIGSGKSTVARYIASKGKVVLDCDVIAKEVMSDSIIKAQIAKALGVSERIVGDKEALSQAIFGDENKRNALNSIVHNAVKIRLMLKRHTAAGDTQLFLDLVLAFLIAAPHGFHKT